MNTRTPTLPQRFLQELDTEWSHLPLAERQHLRTRVATRLEAQIALEQKLGASEEESQRRAVRAVGEECSLQGQVPVRLSPVWQVVLVQLAMGAFLFSFLGFVLPSHGLKEALTVVGAALLATLWHPHAALRGILWGIALSGGLMLGYVLYSYTAVNPALPDTLRAAMLQRNLTALITHALLSLGTVVFALWMRTKKLPKAL